MVTRWLIQFQTSHPYSKRAKAFSSGCFDFIQRKKSSLQRKKVSWPKLDYMFTLTPLNNQGEGYYHHLFRPIIIYPLRLGMYLHLLRWSNPCPKPKQISVQFVGGRGKDGWWAYKEQNLLFFIRYISSNIQNCLTEPPNICCHSQQPIIVNENF